jgi:hypothetical protein
MGSIIGMLGASLGLLVQSALNSGGKSTTKLYRKDYYIVKNLTKKMIII